jgi:hypothetical protein
MSRGVLRSNQPPRSADPNRGNPGRQEGDGDDTPAVHTRGLSYQETILPAPTLTGDRTDAGGAGVVTGAASAACPWFLKSVARTRATLTWPAMRRTPCP